MASNAFANNIEMDFSNAQNRQQPRRAQLLQHQQQPQQIHYQQRRRRPSFLVTNMVAIPVLLLLILRTANVEAAATSTYAPARAIIHRNNLVSPNDISSRSSDSPSLESPQDLFNFSPPKAIKKTSRSYSPAAKYNYYYYYDDDTTTTSPTGSSSSSSNNNRKNHKNTFYDYDYDYHKDDDKGKKSMKVTTTASPSLSTASPMATAITPTATHKGGKKEGVTSSPSKTDNTHDSKKNQSHLYPSYSPRLVGKKDKNNNNMKGDSYYNDNDDHHAKSTKEQHSKGLVHSTKKEKDDDDDDCDDDPRGSNNHTDKLPDHKTIDGAMKTLSPARAMMMMIQPFPPSTKTAPTKQQHTKNIKQTKQDKKKDHWTVEGKDRIHKPTTTTTPTRPSQVPTQRRPTRPRTSRPRTTRPSQFVTEPPTLLESELPSINPLSTTPPVAIPSTFAPSPAPTSNPIPTMAPVVATPDPTTTAPVEAPTGVPTIVTTVPPTIGVPSPTPAPLNPPVTTNLPDPVPIDFLAGFPCDNRLFASINARPADSPYPRFEPIDPSDPDNSLCYLRMTANGETDTAASAFVGVPVPDPTQFSFAMTIGYRLYGADDGEADGMVFVMHQDNRGAEALGNTGGGMGVYGTSSVTIKPALTIEWDTFENPPNLDVGQRNIHVIQVNRDAELTQLAQTVDEEIRTDDSGATIGRMWVEYNCGGSGQLDVTFNNTGSERPQFPNARVDNVRLQDFFFQNGDQILYVGYTASVGGESDNHDIFGWQFEQNC